MNFVFPKECCVNKKLNTDEIIKLLYKEDLKNLNQFMSGIYISSIINSKICDSIKKGKEIDEIYVIRIIMKFPGIPCELLNRLDDYINFPTLYVLDYKGARNYLLSVKLKNKGKNEALRIFYTGWEVGETPTIELFTKDVKTVDDVYKELIYWIADETLDKSKTIREITNEIIEKQKMIKNPAFELNYGVPSFDSIKERFCLFKKSKDGFIQKYLTRFGYHSWQTERHFIKFGNKEVAVCIATRTALYTKFLNEYASGIKVNGNEINIDEYVQRDGDAIKTMKLLYGNYLKTQKKDYDV
ncbi:MAG: hypothetical protein J6T74_00625 [Clostridia bacterium]|nr:hypothetical protein [Clostridia bacterium]